MPTHSGCRICGHALTRTLVDLGVSPLANSYIREDELGRMEPFYPLRAYVCDHCFLVQLDEFESPEHIFADYAYFSSFSSDWLEHARGYADMAIDRFRLNERSKVVEVASNDGYLLQYFRDKGVPVLGVEPAWSVASVAIERGIPTRTVFFDAETSRQLLHAGHGADLLVANNVLAHVPNLHSFVSGLKTLLKPGGAITVEFPHVLHLLDRTQFDTIYHEHFSYFSLRNVERVFLDHGLLVYDVEELPTHGGSLRIYGKHEEDDSKPAHPRVQAVREKEEQGGLYHMDAYASFGDKVAAVKCDLLDFLVRQRRAGKQVAGYGAPAKGNTLLNYCGIGPELLPYTVDLNPRKQGLYLPGSRIPIHRPERIAETRPDYVLILPWNLRREISQQLDFVRAWGGKFVVPIPNVEVL
jgi:SAM-dependent methyltransferase